MSDVWIWGGIALCLVQSGMFSGLNLALLGLSRLQLEVESKSGNLAADRILRLRNDSNFLLTTILWGNVSVNCLLTLLSDSVLLGAAAFVFSTVGITLVGEIAPQAYFSRHAMSVGARLAPFILFYQKVLYPVAKPTALLLDRWLGTEEITYFRERELREVIRQHMLADGADLDRREGLGVLNFLVMDDLPISQEGEPVDPNSVMALPVALDLPVFPEVRDRPDDPFLAKVQASGRKWVILTDTEGVPRLVLDADAYLREVFFTETDVDPYRFCHRPLVVEDGSTPLGSIVRRLRVEPEDHDDDVIDQDMVLLWGDERRIVTGADILGLLMRGIVRRQRPSDAERATLSERGSPRADPDPS